MGAPEVIAKNGATRDADCKKHGVFTQTFIAHSSGGYWVGKCEPCKREEQEEREQAERDNAIWQAYEQSGIPGRFEGKVLSTYKPRTALQRKALATCIKIAEELGISAALLGPPGVGKTHLSVGILHAAIRAYQWRVRYTTAADFLASIAGSWAWNGAKEEAQRFARAPLLVLDEVWHPASERDRESLVALIDARYREELATIVCSNLTWPQLRESLGERPCDRLLEDGGQIIPLDGESYRRQAKGSGK